jgi:hypothetical protein
MYKAPYWPIKAPYFKLKAANILGRYGLPQPVTASHPGAAGKPVVLQPLLDPLTTSVNKTCPHLYSHGLRKPMGGRPSAANASFKRVKTAAAMGEEPDVPTRFNVLPFQMVGKSCPIAAMSG